MDNNPILSSFKNLNLYLVFWFAVMVPYAFLVYFAGDVNLNLAVWDSLAFNIIIGGLGITLWYPARYISFERTSQGRFILTHLVGAVLTSVIWLSIGFFIITRILDEGLQFNEFFFNTLPWRFTVGFLFYFLIISFYYVVIYYSTLQKRTEEEAALRNLVTESELRSLRFQINPHFIYNSLNSMSALTSINPEKARDMIIKLANFMRYTLSSNEKQLSKLSDELKNVKLYLEIEKIRFEDKFEFVEDVKNECLQAEVPGMILQPLFENAVKHAVYDALDLITIKLSCGKDGDFLRITVQNNYDNGGKGSKGTGVGLKNIEKRLALIYQQQSLMKVEKDNGVFTVNIFIPLS